MQHPFIGQLGHFSIIVAFVSAAVTAFAYFRTAQLDTQPDAADWRKLARGAFFVHAAAVLTVVGSLYTIIYNHYFEYHYAWDNSSRSLPVQYVISSFWQDQEGSFLLWIFWHAILGTILIALYRKGTLNAITRKGTPRFDWEAPTLAIFAAVQAFLCSMILGVFIPGLDFKIGSTPFLTLQEAHPEWAVWALQPNFIPEDGNGLNPLLQSYWMVIHPPTLFLGFALTLVPFAFCLAGLWKGQYKEWVRAALPWTLLATLILGVGILMGAYWAYETLNFGGYWNWDPVENAIYVPWLVLVAGLHTMIIYNSNKTALRTSMVLIVTMFVLMLYSTFLTRSGVLGNDSVHSFTDLGLSGQLLVYLGFFTLLSVGLLVKNWNQIPSDEKEVSTYSREFWIFCGATVLCLASFQVLATTSIPAFNALLGAFKIKSTLALPADQIGHFTKFQLWFFVVITILTGIGQYFWWGKIRKPVVGSPESTAANKKTASATLTTTRGFSLNLGPWEAFSTALMVTFVLAAVIISLGNVRDWQYIVLLTAAVFALVTNGSVIWSVLRSKAKLSGGSVAHIGVALMLIGILFSSGYSNTVTKNRSGLLIFNDPEMDAKENVDNQLLWLNQPQQLDKFRVTYKGQRFEARDVPGYLPKKLVEYIEGDFRAVAKEDIVQNGKTYYRKGDTLEIYPENTYYEVEYREPNGRVFSLYPRWQVNPRMGNAVSPSIRKEWGRDVYTHVTSAPMPNQEREWSKTETVSLALKDTFFLNDQVAILENIVRVDEVDGVKMGAGDAAVQAVIRVLDKEGQSVELRPTYIIKDRLVGRPAVVNEDLGLRAQFTEIDPQTGRFGFALNSTQRDYIVMKAVEKPLINVLWIGTLVLTVGFLMATVRRFREIKLNV